MGRRPTGYAANHTKKIKPRALRRAQGIVIKGQARERYRDKKRQQGLWSGSGAG